MYLGRDGRSPFGRRDAVTQRKATVFDSLLEFSTQLFAIVARFPVRQSGLRPMRWVDRKATALGS